MYRDESMNALADKAHKRGMPHSDTHSLCNLTWPHYSITILIHKSISGMPVGTKFTDTYMWQSQIEFRYYAGLISLN